MILRVPVEAWYAADDEAAEALARRLPEDLPEADVRPLGGHPKAVVAVVLLVSPRFAAATLQDGRLAAGLATLLEGTTSNADAAIMPVVVDGVWEDVAPDDLRQATPFDARVDGEWEALIIAMRDLLAAGMA